MKKLYCKNKGHFQAKHFADLVEDFFEGGNHKEGVSVKQEMIEILDGLSEAWDKAQNQEQN